MKQELSHWSIFYDKAGVENPADLPSTVGWGEVSVPGVWQEQNPQHDGVAWYKTNITIRESDAQQHIRLHFEAVHYLCEVYCQGKKMGGHEGGYTPFTISLDSGVQLGENTIYVRVLCPPREREVEGYRVGEPLNQSNIPTWKAGWYYPFGGLWQAAHLEILPKCFAQDLYLTTEISPKTLNITFDLKNLFESAQNTVVHWRVTPWKQSEVLASGSMPVLTQPGSSIQKISVPLPDAKLWSLESPHLYTVELSIENQGQSSQHVERFGLREFTTDGAFFYLNGARVILKGTLHQGVFPQSIAAPKNEAMARKDMELLKASNANFVRLHIKPAPPITLNLADELGLLCMGEPPIGWITYDEKVVERCVHNVRELVRRDRNHPSLVIWCLFNELCDTVYNRSQSEASMIEPCAKAAWEMDDSRLMIDKSGGRHVLSDAKVKNGIRCPKTNGVLPITDVHSYLRIPIKAEALTGLRKMGEGKDGLLLTSEFGTSAFPNLNKVIDTYSPEEQALGLRELVQMRNYRDNVNKGYEAYGLEQHFGNMDEFYEALQLDQCQATDAMMRALRNHPKNSGYIITQHADAASEFGGIVDLWREPKAVYEVFKHNNSEQLLTISLSETSIYIDQVVELRVELSDQSPNTVAVSGNLAIRLEGQPVESIALKGAGDLVTACYEGSWSNSTPGKYHFHAQINIEGKIVEHEVMLHVVDRPKIKKLQVYDTLVEVGRGKKLANLLKQSGYEVEPFYNQANDPNAVVVARFSGRDETLRSVEMQRVLRKHIEQGGSAILLESELSSMHSFFGHSIREYYGVGSYAGNVGFSLDPNVFKHTGPFGHLGRPYAVGYPRVHAHLEEIQQHGLQPMAIHIVPDQFGNPDVVKWGCSAFRGRLGKGQFWVLQFHAEEFLLENPAMSKDFDTLLQMASSSILKT